MVSKLILQQSSNITPYIQYRMNSQVGRSPRGMKIFNVRQSRIDLVQAQSMPPQSSHSVEEYDRLRALNGQLATELSFLRGQMPANPCDLHAVYRVQIELELSQLPAKIREVLQGYCYSEHLEIAVARVISTVASMQSRVLQKGSCGSSVNLQHCLEANAPHSQKHYYEFNQANHSYGFQQSFHSSPDKNSLYELSRSSSKSLLEVSPQQKSAQFNEITNVQPPEMRDERKERVLTIKKDITSMLEERSHLTPCYSFEIKKQNQKGKIANSQGLLLSTLPVDSQLIIEIEQTPSSLQFQDEYYGGFKEYEQLEEKIDKRRTYELAKQKERKKIFQKEIKL